MLSIKGFAQTASVVETSTLIEKGTYQFLYMNRSEEEKINLTSDQLDKLKNLRDQERDLYVRITEKTLIKLFSTNFITSAQFNPNNYLDNLYYMEINPEDFGGINIFEQAVNLK